MVGSYGKGFQKGIGFATGVLHSRKIQLKNPMKFVASFVQIIREPLSRSMKHSGRILCVQSTCQASHMRMTVKKRSQARCPRNVLESNVNTVRKLMVLQLSASSISVICHIT